MVNTTPSSDTAHSPDPSQAFDELAGLVVSHITRTGSLRNCCRLVMPESARRIALLSGAFNG